MTQYRLQKLYSNNVQLLVPSKGGQAGHDTQLEGREEYKILVGRHPKKKKSITRNRPEWQNYIKTGLTETFREDVVDLF